MSEAKVRLKLIVVQGKKTIGVSPNDLGRILKSPRFATTPPKVVPKKKNNIVTLKADTKKVTARDVLNTTRLGMDIAGKLMDVVRSRAQHLVMTVDRSKNEALHTACRAVFGQDWNGKITFAAYEELLQRHKAYLDVLRTIN